ncbi:amino acid transporter [Gonapodya prolifera JEL478]|uniref:Amino acid transporter n=1 Tax=Gonapodya prolifera (strain JEL478) TaxID=1344416 RepID=A0A139AGH6_GONPJ|nr:amino acid transporter [Gonapodya prolifera JEL478]|eukprot:KXS15932.1 amino acid transporter [Gonapodya prolifera JEL478]
MAAILGKLFRRKRVDVIIAEGETLGYRKSLTWIDLTMLGLGGIIGAGIFALTGSAARNYAGPGIIISFVIAGIVSAFAAFTYSELSALIPISGSAYTFTYATLGELLAWIIGWDLILEYLVSAAAVAVAWSTYFEAFFVDTFGIGFNVGPTTVCGGNDITDGTTNCFYKGFRFEVSQPPIVWDEPSGSIIRNCKCLDGSDPCLDSNPTRACGVLCLPGMALCIALTVLLVVGMKESARFNNFIVCLKIVVILMFIFAGIKWINPDNYKPFIPDPIGQQYGSQGIFRGAQVVFFAYIGFDAVSTVAQEASNPQRDMPIGICLSLLISTGLYICVCAVMVGLMKYTEIPSNAPISAVIGVTGLKWMQSIVDIGAICGLGSVTLVSLMGQPRIFNAMARDGLLPAFFAKMHPKFHTPIVTTIITGVLATIAAGLLPVDILANLTSIGTLLAFFLVSGGVLILRYTDHNRYRPFRVGGQGMAGTIIGPIVALLGCVTSMGLIVLSGNRETAIRVGVWLAIGFVVYFGYAFWHSNLAKHPDWYLDNSKHPELQLAAHTATSVVRGENKEMGGADQMPPMVGH